MASEEQALAAADVVYAAERSLRRAGMAVQDLHDTVNSALRVLDDAELDSAKSRLTDGRGDLYLEAAADHLGRLQTRCEDMVTVADEVAGHLAHAERALTEAATLLDQVDPSDPAIAQLRPRLTVLDEMVQLAKPVVRDAHDHLESAGLMSRNMPATALLEPQDPDRTIRNAGKELGRADEDVRLLDRVVERATSTAHQTTGLAAEISDNARQRMADHAREHHASPQHAPPIGAPSR